MNNVIGLGTAAIGRPQYINLRQEGAPTLSLAAFRQQGIAVLNAAYDQGVRYFDTAPGYGMAEQLLIEWVQKKQDADIEVATKWGYTYVANFDPNASQHEVKEHSLAKLKEQWAQSQQLLPWLTTYQIHSATLATGVLENAAVLRRLAELKTKHQLHIGLTTTGADQLEVLKRSLEVEVDGIPLFDAFQVTYNIFDQSLAALAETFSSSGKRLIIKEALANGRTFPNDSYPHYQKAYALLSSLAHKYEVGVDAVALRFCVDSLPAYKVLSGAANVMHLTANLQTLTFELESPEMAALQAMAIAPENYWQERKKLSWN
jgi:aryl-alcohol dehydrogenase-like predicted oxidoreductase